eukprot:210648_1
MMIKIVEWLMMCNKHNAIHRKHSEKLRKNHRRRKVNFNFVVKQPKKYQAIPAASQFGNVWELNFSPMSRSSYSQSKKSKTKATKKVKHKSGHVRRKAIGGHMHRALNNAKRDESNDFDTFQDRNGMERTVRTINIDDLDAFEDDNEFHQHLDALQK